MENRLSEEGVWETQNPGATLGPNDPRRLAVRAGCFVTPELLSMFASVAGGRRAYAEAAVARRAWSLLRDWGGEGLRQDLALLAVHSAQHGRGDGDEDSEQRFWEFLLVHYHEVRPRCSRPCRPRPRCAWCASPATKKRSGSIGWTGDGRLSVTFAIPTTASFSAPRVGTWPGVSKRF